MFDALLQDIRYALRHLRRSPGFAAAAILTLAFGIGANTAMFTMLNALVLQRLPIKDPDALMSVTSRNARGSERYIPFPAVDVLAKDGPFLDVCGYNGGGIIAVEANGSPTQALVAFVSGRCFTTFGVMPIIGRPINDDDAPLVSAGNRVVLLSHHFWTRMYGADPAAIGKAIHTAGVDATVIGVTPPGFGGLHVDSGVDIFAPPDTLIPARADRRPVASQILGRLKPGITLAQARAEMSARWTELLKASLPPASNPQEGADIFGATLKVDSIGRGISGFRDRYTPALELILGLTALLLVLACVNLGGLLLTRLSARANEMTVRLALGGSRQRIAQQMLVESILLAMTGAALAVPVSFAFVGPLASFIPPSIVAPTIAFRPDVRVLAVTALVGLAVGVLMTALPTWFALRRSASVSFTWDRTIAGTTSKWARALLVAQVALSVTMVIGAGLLIRSLYLLQHTDLGLRTSNVINVKAWSVPDGYRGVDPAAYYPALLEKIAALPGVESSGMARLFPRAGSDPNASIAFVGEEMGDVRTYMESASTGFFATVGIPLVAGRLTTWADNLKTQRVGLVSASLAKALAPDGGVLDRHVKLGTDRNMQDIVIVGVVGDATVGNLRLNKAPVLYVPPLQVTGNFTNPSIVVAAHTDQASVIAGVRQILREGGREYAQEVITLEDLFARAPSSERMSATLAGAVGALAILLALIGIHGTLAYAVSRRTREIGVRVAIGASPAEVARSVLREGFLVTLAGVALGLPLALLAARLLGALLFGVSESDALTFTLTAGFFLAMGTAAGVIPARRAANVDPMIALRAE